MKARTLRFFLFVIIAGLVGYYIGVMKISWDWQVYYPQVNVISKEPPPSVTNVDMTQFWSVLDKINSLYYDRSKINPQEMVNGAIEGMVSTLNDPYTLYLPPQNNASFKQQLAGQFEGIGAELGMKGKDIVVVAPLDGSPAEKAGLKAGDILLKIDGQTDSGLSLNDAVNKIRGPKGTKVTLTVMHKSETQPTDITITRDTINVKSVAMWIKNVKDIDGIDTNKLKGFANAKVAYVRLSQFGDNTNQEWLDAANKIALSMQKDSSIKGVILDLRNNPGGYLNDAAFIASEFIPSGTIVIQQDGRGDQTDLSVSRKGLLTNVRLVVLINKGSASASEIVSGALRDHGRAKLVGENSFGKGIVQQAEDMGGGAGLHVTTAKWLTPKGSWVGNGKDGVGLTPDISVPLDPKDPSHDTQLEKAVQAIVE